MPHMHRRVLVFVGVAAIGILVATAATRGGTPAARSHGDEVSGTISNVNASLGTFTVRRASGASITLHWTAATKVLGGQLAAGREAVVRYLSKDGKRVATGEHLERHDA